MLAAPARDPGIVSESALLLWVISRISAEMAVNAVPPPVAIRISGR